MKTICLVVVLMLIVNTAVAQEGKEGEEGEGGRFKLAAGVFNEAITIPGIGGIIKLPIHPGICVGAERSYLDKNGSTLFQTLNLGGYYHRDVHYGVFLNTQTGYRYTARFGVSAEALAGVGYLHTFPDGPVFTMDDSGEYEQAFFWGRPRFMPSLSIGVGYDFAQKQIAPIALFVRHQVFFEIPCAPKVPLMPHTAFSVGIRYSLNDKTEE
jgi:hypothetical protein